MVSAPSIVKLHNQSYTLTAPVVAAADWDATVAFTGCNSEIGKLPGLVTQGAGNDDVCAYVSNAFSAGAPFGSFIIKAGVAGADMTFGSPTVVDATNLAYGACQVDPNSDRCRIIAVAFEVTNTTADIYKQGSLTVGQLPSAVNDYGLVAYLDGKAADPVPLFERQSWNSAKFAANRDALVAIPGSCSWAAKDGVYAIPRMITHTMPVDAPSYNKRAAVVQSSASDTLYHISTPSSFTTSLPYVAGVAASGFSALQVFFTGLSHETSLVITMRTLVEYFPSFNSPLLMLTTPSPPFCPKVFEIYSKTCQIAPYAVPVKQNGAGAYFRGLMRVLSVAAMAAAPLTGPFAPYVAAAGTFAGSAADIMDARKDERRAAKTRTQAPHKPLPIPPVRRNEAGARAAPTRR